MRFSFALQKPRQLTRSEAWSCFTANLAFPGSGSLVAGYPIGYAQLISTFIGFGVFTISGLHFITWFLTNWQRLTSEAPFDDPFANLVEIGHALKWPGIGFGLFVFTLLWGLHTSLQILRNTPKT